MLIDDVKTAVEVFNRQKPSKSSKQRFENKVKKHLERDYSQARGLAMLGISGNKTKPFIEVDINTDSNKIDFDLMVAVFVNDEWIVFAKSEALGYNDFIMSPKTYAERLEQVKAESIAAKRKS